MGICGTNRIANERHTKGQNSQHLVCNNNANKNNNSNNQGYKVLGDGEVKREDQKQINCRKIIEI